MRKLLALFMAVLASCNAIWPTEESFEKWTEQLRLDAQKKINEIAPGCFKCIYHEPRSRKVNYPPDQVFYARASKTENGGYTITPDGFFMGQSEPQHISGDASLETACSNIVTYLMSRFDTLKGTATGGTNEEKEVDMNTPLKNAFTNDKSLYLHCLYSEDMYDPTHTYVVQIAQEGNDYFLVDFLDTKLARFDGNKPLKTICQDALKNNITRQNSNFVGILYSQDPKACEHWDF